MKHPGSMAAVPGCCCFGCKSMSSRSQERLYLVTVYRYSTRIRMFRRQEWHVMQHENEPLRPLQSPRVLHNLHKSACYAASPKSGQKVKKTGGKSGGVTVQACHVTRVRRPCEQGCGGIAPPWSHKESFKVPEVSHKRAARGLPRCFMGARKG